MFRMEIESLKFPIKVFNALENKPYAINFVIARKRFLCTITVAFLVAQILREAFICQNCNKSSHISKNFVSA